MLAVIGASRTPDSYLAGGAAIHFTLNSLRYSGDLDFFHDSVERVATAYAADHALLSGAGYAVEIEISQPGFVRAIVLSGSDATRIDWAHDSAWRFMPPVQDALGGFLLHPVDLAVNKTLALAGRDEPRDFVDILYVHERVLPLAGLVWAGAGKDPGFSPVSLLEMLRRRGRHRPEEIARLDLVAPFDLISAKTTWLAALDDADSFVRSRPADEVGCLYYSPGRRAFVLPRPADPCDDVVAHFGRPGGVLPQPARVKGRPAD
ncbi:MAG: hypothetical protein ABIR58_01415 [Gemmatimonadaceae bacterium]